MGMQVQVLALPSGLRIQCCHELWCRPTAVAPIRPLAWELPYAVGAALKRKKKKSCIPTLQIQVVRLREVKVTQLALPGPGQCP